MVSVTLHDAGEDNAFKPLPGTCRRRGRLVSAWVDLREKLTSHSGVRHGLGKGLGDGEIRAVSLSQAPERDAQRMKSSPTERNDHHFDGRGMIPDHDERSYMRAVAVAVLVAISGVGLRAHIPRDPRGELNPFAGAINIWAALAIVVIVLGIALFVVTRPITARIADWHRAVLASAEDGAEWRPPAHPRPIKQPSTRSFVVLGFCLALSAEFVAVCLPDRSEARALTGVAVGLLLLSARNYMGVVADPPPSDAVPDDAGDSLQHWVSRTEALIGWSETTRSDWDQRVRPVLARQFEMATKANQRRTTDPAEFQATGKMLFGADLWPWVDPDNVVRGVVSRRGPGRQTLERILQCLERV